MGLRRVESGKQVRVILWLAFFGALGTMARYGLEGWIHHRTGAAFPAGTLAVNLAGCLLLGAVGRYAFNHIAFPPNLRTGITIGFFGAFTTFSTFSLDVATLYERGALVSAAAYMLASFVLAVGALFVGLALARMALT